jgi:hypothetical protein
METTTIITPEMLQGLLNSTDTWKPGEYIKSLTAEDFEKMKDNIPSIPTITLDQVNKLAATVVKFSDEAVKHDSDKPPMNLLSREALEQTAMVMAFGKEKYAAHNWRGGFAWSRPLSAAMRHLMAFNDGEDKDPESGLSHLAHAACCIMFLLEFEKTHKHLDDRFKPTK